jgi:UDP-hydrolysing UDP-N-acetyl-D-glucosamine 2-epimerase
MHEIVADSSLDLRLIVTGAHLTARFGETWREIATDGFTIDRRLDIAVDDDTPVGVGHAMGRAVGGLTQAIAELSPDIVVLLGDRYEILAAAAAALLLRIPVGHIHGGEVTEGAIDDAMRHAITKMAHLHFASAEPYRQRIIQMGESPEHVFSVGALGSEAAARVSSLRRSDLAAIVGIEIKDPLFVVTYHPETLGSIPPGDVASAILQALDDFPTASVVFTGVNADAGNREIAERFTAYVHRHSSRAAWHNSLGQNSYISLMRHAAAVVGNSSSGVIEAPALRVPTVNIGDRQKGRLRAASVIDCRETAEDISRATARALSPEFRTILRDFTPPFGAGNIASRIRDILRDIPLTGLTRKSFHDLPSAA